jgi:hypothetical protein
MKKIYLRDHPKQHETTITDFVCLASSGFVWFRGSSFSCLNLVSFDLAQLLILSLRFLQDGKIAVGIFPEREKVLIGGARCGRDFMTPRHEVKDSTGEIDRQTSCSTSG